MNTKIEAIARLEKIFTYNPLFRKDFKDYIELCIIEEAEKHRVTMSAKKEAKFVKDCSEHIIRLLFDSDWWAAQLGSNTKKTKQ
jgi:hypothetical protein